MTKITAEHLARGAFVYVRQSTADQVHNNHESRRRQYGLADRAHESGFGAPRRGPACRCSSLRPLRSQASRRLQRHEWQLGALSLPRPAKSITAVIGVFPSVGCASTVLSAPR